MKRLTTFLLLAYGCGGSGGAQAPISAPAAPVGDDLRTPASFASITDASARSRAVFLEASRVMLHPRCINCHPDGDTPAQGDDLRTHDPPVVRGPKDEGVPGLLCSSCHQDHNLPLQRVPGAEKWHLAGREMAWVRRTPAALCAQLKNPERNGHKTLAEIVEHAKHDKLVAWGWDPGHGRVKAPGTQAKYGALMQAWMDTGAACPEEERR